MAYVPVILSAMLTPNPAKAGEAVLVSVSAIDFDMIPSPQVITAGEFTAGEV